jgi:TPR repeat protein
MPGEQDNAMSSTRIRLAALAVASLAVAACLAQGQTTAGLNAPQLFEKGMNLLTGSGVSRSGFDAIEYFQRSADLGYAPAQVVMGYFFETGKFTAKEPAQALSWYKKAAAGGDPLAQWLAGRMIYAGSVPPRDLNEASELLQSAAKQGNPFAEYLLGKIKLERQLYSQAADLLRQAAEQGLPQAQQQLAILLRDGQGVSIDRFEAYVWLLLSDRAGNRSVAGDLQALEADLGTNEMERAKSKAQAMEGSVTRSVVAHGCTGWPGEFDTIPTPPPPDLQRFCR